MNKLQAILAVGLLALSQPSWSGAPQQDCALCHGDSGYVADADTPTIGGVSAYYLETAMLVYQDRGRSCPPIEYPESAAKSGTTTMCEIADGLDEEQIAAVAKYFAGQSFKAHEQPVDAAKVARGEKVHQAYCGKCHSDNGGAAADDAGILAGQKCAYLTFVLQDYRDGKRPTLKKMLQSIDALSAEDVEALVHFYAAQK